MLSSFENKPHIKICGLRDSNTIREMNGLNIRYVGLVFAPSKRQVTLEEGKLLVSAIHNIEDQAGQGIEAAAVCVNMPIEQLIQLVNETDIDIVQLHGQEDKSYIEQCKKSLPHTKVWRALSIKDDQSVSILIEQLESYITHLDALVIDAPGGGTGTVFNWQAIELFQTITRQYNCRLIVAGGLHEDNVAQLLSSYEIDGVDVSSGVETEGVKDINKIKRFVGKVIEG